MFQIKSKGVKYKLSGLLIGIVFGFLLHKGNVTDYNVLVGQLLLKDFTVFKVIISAIITGMLGVYFLKSKNLIQLHLKTGAVASLITGSLIFGIGFGLLGYCPGTLIGAIGEGSMDALLGGFPGMILGAAFYAHIYSKIQNSFFEKKQLKKINIIEYFDYQPKVIILSMTVILILSLILIEIII